MKIPPNPATPQLDKALQALSKSLPENQCFGIDPDKSTFSEMFQNKLFLVHVIRQGIPYNLFELIAAESPFDLSEWATFLDLSTKSLQRYKEENRTFERIQSEKILELVEVTQFGVEVFGDMDTLRIWLRTPSFVLGRMTPIALLGYSFGRQLVMTELVHIEHGIFA